MSHGDHRVSDGRFGCDPAGSDSGKGVFQKLGDYVVAGVWLGADVGYGLKKQYRGQHESRQDKAVLADLDDRC